MCPCSMLFQERAVDWASLRLSNTRWPFSCSLGILWMAQLLPIGCHSVLLRVRPPWLNALAVRLSLVKNLVNWQEKGFGNQEGSFPNFRSKQQDRCFELHSVFYWMRDSKEDVRGCSLVCHFTLRANSQHFKTRRTW